jgi:hypothetical protein
VNNYFKDLIPGDPAKRAFLLKINIEDALAEWI